MSLLLDTHVLLWWLDNPRQLSRESVRAIRDGKNRVFVSAATIWEITIKKQLGKLKAPDDLESVVARNRFSALPVTFAHALAVADLPNHHRDPFDRLLVAQSVVEGLRLVSRDAWIQKYQLNIILA